MKAGPSGKATEPSPLPDRDAIAGRVILSSGEEFSCLARNVTPMEADLSGSLTVEAGETLVCHLDEIGLLPGRIVAVGRKSFRVAFTLSGGHRTRIAAQLEWHAGRATQRANLRRSPRIVPLHRAVEVRLGEKLVWPGTIQNISMSGVAVSLDAAAIPFIGGRVRIGSRYATVVRVVEGGIAAEFAEPFTADNFDERVRP